MLNYDIALDNLITRRKLPSSRDGLMLADHDGWTIAHSAAVHGLLTMDFGMWDITDKDGYSVAHAYASVSSFPANFLGWHLKDKEGRTVAEIAAINGTLPLNYPKWDEFGTNGDTLAHIAAKHGKFPAKLMDSRRIMSLQNKRGITVEAVMNARGKAMLEACKDILKKKS